VRPEAAHALARALETLGNPASVHGFGRASRALVEQARADVARLVGAEPTQVTFTSGGSEANNLALNAPSWRVLVSAVEHDSIRDAARATLIPVDRDGVVDLATLDRALADGPALVAVMLANHETGVIQPIAEVARLVHAVGGWLHVDAVQAAGRIAIDFAALGADSMAISAHKLGGPQGVGALIARESAPFRPLLAGGGQERGRRAGTPNVPGIAGFAAAAITALAERDAMSQRACWRDRMEDRLRAACPELIIPGSGAERVANTSCLAMPGVAAATQVMALDLAGFAVSAGAACSSGRVTASRVVEAMGLGADVAGSAIRVSLGWRNTEQELDSFSGAWIDLWDRLGRRRILPAA
jgi:cysteine desulfurase